MRHSKNFLSTYVFLAASFLAIILQLTACKDDPSSSDKVEVDDNSIPEKYVDLVSALDSTISPVDGSAPFLTNGDLASLSNLADAKIVALGEATHGTKEFFQMKHRILKYLVEEHGFNAFAIEADMGESVFIDRYVVSGKGNIENIMKEKMHFWTWRTSEVKELIQWMKNYNMSQPEDQKIRYIGVDCQFTAYQPELISDFFNDYMPEVENKIRYLLSDISYINDLSYTERNDFYSNLEMDEYKSTQSKLDTLELTLAANKGELLSVTSAFEFNTISRLIENLKQSFLVRYYIAKGISSYNYRDKYMADNSKWILDLLGDNSKIVLWAHNAHISNYSGYGSMGMHLKGELGKNYQMIGFSFTFGSFAAIAQVGNKYTNLKPHTISVLPRDPSVNLLFHYSEHDNFILRFEDIAKDNDLYKWLSNQMPFRSIGAVYNGISNDYFYEMDILTCFDYLIHFENTTASEQLALAHK